LDWVFANSHGSVWCHSFFMQIVILMCILVNLKHIAEVLQIRMQWLPVFFFENHVILCVCLLGMLLLDTFMGPTVIHIQIHQCHSWKRTH
jgi:hypothetical protein